MVNKYKGEVEINLQGKPRVIRFNTNAWVALEEALGDTLQGILLKVQPEDGDASKAQWSFRQIRAFIYAGLLGAKAKGVTLNAVGNAMDGEDLGYLTEKIMEAVALALPDKSKDEEEEESSDPLELEKAPEGSQPSE